MSDLYQLIVSVKVIGTEHPSKCLVGTFKLPQNIIDKDDGTRHEGSIPLRIMQEIKRRPHLYGGLWDFFWKAIYVDLDSIGTDGFLPHHSHYHPIPKSLIAKIKLEKCTDAKIFQKHVINTLTPEEMVALFMDYYDSKSREAGSNDLVCNIERIERIIDLTKI